MSTRNLDKMMAPQSVVAIGASVRPGSVGEAVTRNLLTGGFGGDIHLVNVKGGEIAGRPVVKSLAELKQPADLAVIMTPPETVPRLVLELGECGTRVAVANGRLSPRSFPRYRRLRPLLARVLREVDVFLMQGEAHAERARDLGAPPARVRVTGNIKYDAPAAGGASSSGMKALLGEGADAPLWVAGSTMAGEEELVFRAFAEARAALERAWLEARLPSEREHVTPYIWKHPELFRLGSVQHSEDLSDLRWTIDEPEDLMFVRALYDSLGAFPSGIAETIQLLKEHPELAEINKGFESNEGYEKSLREDEEFEMLEER